MTIYVAAIRSDGHLKAVLAMQGTEITTFEDIHEARLFLLSVDEVITWGTPFSAVYRGFDEELLDDTETRGRWIDLRAILFNRTKTVIRFSEAINQTLEVKVPRARSRELADMIDSAKELLPLLKSLVEFIERTGVIKWKIANRIETTDIDLNLVRVQKDLPD